jgi:adenylate cyclase
VERKLTAILCADVHGYSRLMGEDEEATLRTLTAYRKLIDNLIQQHHGRFVDSAGDSVLAEFASVVNAMQCAVEIQNMLKAENVSLPPERRMEFRIGVNLGDVMVEGEQIYGDGVNVAARLESLAEPGGICISGTVHEHVEKKLALNYRDLGEQTVKNITRPVRVWRVLPEAGAATTRKPQRVQRQYVRRGAFSLAGLAIIAAAILLVQHISLKPPRTSASIPPAQSPALPLPSIPSIAVLPFTNLSGDPQQEYFSDGITDELITDLSRLPNVFVIARNSTFTYKGKAIKLQEIGRELGVRLVLEGSVFKAGDQVWITARLADATTGTDLWAERYERPLRDIFSLQNEIVRRIVTTLNLQLSLWERGIVARRRTDSLRAYDYFLRGLEFQSSMTSEGNSKAQRMFQKALELDPNYADAYASLGWAEWLDLFLQWRRDEPKALDRISELARKVISLDEFNPLAHIVQSGVDLSKRKYDEADSEAERAIALDPNFPPAYSWLAEALIHSGDYTEAIGSAQKAMRLDPRNQDLYLGEEGIARTFNRQYGQAIPLLEKSLASYPNNLGPRLALTIAYSETGRDADAREQAVEIRRISPAFTVEALQHGLPLKDPALRERNRVDFLKAGLK